MALDIYLRPQLHYTDLDVSARYGKLGGNLRRHHDEVIDIERAKVENLRLIPATCDIFIRARWVEEHTQQRYQIAKLKRFRLYKTSLRLEGQILL